MSCRKTFSRCGNAIRSIFVEVRRRNKSTICTKDKATTAGLIAVNHGEGGFVAVALRCCFWCGLWKRSKPSTLPREVSYVLGKFLPISQSRILAAMADRHCVVYIM